MALLNGLVWATVVGIYTMIFFKTTLLAVILFAAMIINLLAAAIVGVTVPLVLKPLPARDSLSDVPLQYNMGIAVRRKDKEFRDSLQAVAVVYGAQAEVDAYIAALIGSGLALRSLELTETPLEALFFMLTESAPGGVPVGLDTHPEGVTP